MAVLIVLLGFSWLVCVKGEVSSFSLKEGDIPQSGGTVHLHCSVTTATRNVEIGTNSPAEHALAMCYGTDCLPSSFFNYAFSMKNNTVEVKIKNLQRKTNEKVWFCSQEQKTLEYNLLVYDVPKSITLEGPPTCNLGISSCTFICKTKSCTYPRPKFIWIYAAENGASSAEPLRHGRKTQVQESDSCTDVARIFKETLSLAQYTVFNSNENKTIQIWCKIQFDDFPILSLQSNSSVFLSFAVKVQNVSIYDGQMPLQAGAILSVDEFSEKTLYCVPGFGNPLPSTNWYIGSIKQGSDPIFTFTPNNTLHNKRIFCEVANFPENRMESAKPKLYVKVKIKNVYIEPASNNFLEVIQDTQEPVICATSGGRPSSTIIWLKLIDGRQENLGNSYSVDHRYTKSGLEVTKGTKYVTVSRQDSDWILSCEASNSQNPATIAANNSKSFNVLYPPEMMGISYSDESVTGAVIDVVRGANVSLKCTADGNPLVESFFWSMHDKKLVGEILTIENIRNHRTVQCTAKNTMKSTSGLVKQGSGSITKEINVLYEATITRFAVLRKGKTESEDTILVNENALMSIVCDVDSNPGSTISLKQSHKMLSVHQNSHNLVYNISSAKCSHNGEYTCTAWNGIKTDVRAAERKLQINVMCSPILAEETDTTVIGLQNKPTILSVTVIAFPMPTHYNWFKNTSSGWQAVTNSSDIEITHTSLEFNLKLRKVRDEDYGIYNLTVGNGIGHPSGFLLLLQAQEGPKPQSDATDNRSMAGIIGGVIGGLLVAGLVISVLCILRKRNCFDGKFICELDKPFTDIKTNLFGPKSKISRDVTASKIDEGTVYENLKILTEASKTAYPAKKEKTVSVKETNLTSQSYGGLKDADIVFSDRTASPCSKKKNNNGGQSKSKRNASQKDEESANGGECRAEPEVYEELEGTREQFHVYKTLQQDTGVRAQDSAYESIDSRHRQDHTYESMH